CSSSAAAASAASSSAMAWPSSSSASGVLGVTRLASGSSRLRSASRASSASSLAPEVATITGSSTTCGGRCASSASATAWMTSAEASMPSLTAPMRKSSKQASICARRNCTGGTCTAVTPRVCWAVSAASADRPCTRWAAKVRRSAWMPAPPPESEPAMVRAQTGRGSWADMVASEHFRRVVGQARTLAAAQGDVGAVAPVLEAVHGVGQAGGGFGEVGRVDLLDVAHADDLGAGAGAGDQGFHLLGRQVLRLVDDHPAVEEGAAAHEVHRADLDAAGQQLVGGAAAPGAVILGVGEHFQVVGQRAHPGRHLLFLGAGQEADVLAD